MAKLVLLDSQGRNLADVSCSTMLPKDFVLPEGMVLSWEERFGTNLSRAYIISAITYKKAKAFLHFHIDGSGSIRVESPNPEDLFELIDIAILRIGGQVIPALPLGDRDIPSIGTIIRADFHRLCARVKGFFQRIGMKMALQGS